MQIRLGASFVANRCAASCRSPPMRKHAPESSFKFSAAELEALRDKWDIPARADSGVYTKTRGGNWLGKTKGKNSSAYGHAVGTDWRTRERQRAIVTMLLFSAWSTSVATVSADADSIRFASRGGAPTRWAKFFLGLSQSFFRSTPTGRREPVFWRAWVGKSQHFYEMWLESGSSEDYMYDPSAVDAYRFMDEEYVDFALEAGTESAFSDRHTDLVNTKPKNSSFPAAA